MPILNGFDAAKAIRELASEASSPLGRDPERKSRRLNGGRIPIFAVSASLSESQHEELNKLGMDGWILKPIDFKRLRIILRGVVDPLQREKDVYRPGINWEIGGWLSRPKHKVL